MKKLSLQEVLEGIEDTRRRRNVWYPLYEVLFIMLTAVICGATSYAKVEMFGKSKETWLKKYLKLENGVPDVFLVFKEDSITPTDQVAVSLMEDIEDDA